MNSVSYVEKIEQIASKHWRCRITCAHPGCLKVGEMVMLASLVAEGIIPTAWYCEFHQTRPG